MLVFPYRAPMTISSGNMTPQHKPGQLSKGRGKVSLAQSSGIWTVNLYNITRSPNGTSLSLRPLLRLLIGLAASKEFHLTIFYG